MLTSWKTIAVFFDDTPEGTTVASLAVAIADRCSAHLVGIYGVSRNPGESAADSFARGKSAIHDMIARRHAAERAVAAKLDRHFTSIVRRHSVSSEFRLIGSQHTQDDPLIHSLHADLIVLGYPSSPGLSALWTAERLVLASGVPALFVPGNWTSNTVGQNILVAWNGSREARRALIDAMPLLKSANSVAVLVVDALETPDRFGAEPGADISHYLARHGVTVELRQVTSGGASVGQAILAQAARHGSDLIVIGAYSHKRFVELIFGGVTRELLASGSIPLLLSH